MTVDNKKCDLSGWLVGVKDDTYEATSFRTGISHTHNTNPVNSAICRLIPETKRMNRRILVSFKRAGKLGLNNRIHPSVSPYVGLSNRLNIFTHLDAHITQLSSTIRNSEVIWVYFH